MDRKERLIREIANEARYTGDETGRPQFSERVLTAIRNTWSACRRT